ncbi:hypothetical protein EUGRSUZ_C01125 [Eucalyptus grandis]|uniref:Bulb-type lectin domain-containing protein n=2 Tax=Eucalyptus grandis TaxID=71139 RepID=A0A059CNJ7_EUCGR|nr:hypothetical protein EUGRSUZ_C01125 [Eucalyptus grandis]
MAIKLIFGKHSLSIRYDGNLVISDRRLIQVLVNPVMLATNNSTNAVLLDSGNFVLVEGETTVWKSFYYPSDTFLPGMKLGFVNLGTDKTREQFLVSWQSPSVPSTGFFVLALIATTNETQLVFHHDDVSRVFTMIGKEISVVYSPICTNTSSSSTDCQIEKPALCPDGNNFRIKEGFVSKPNAFNELDCLGIIDCEIMCRSNCSCKAVGTYRDDGMGCQFFYGDLIFFADGPMEWVHACSRNINEAAAHVRRKASGFSAATSNFSAENKLDEGGFGPVYKNGVKRLLNRKDTFYASQKKKGIAQGLLYLHQYSRLRDIHHDLKTSNINMEYAVYGFFSTKFVVFSFGLIMLEIISGRKNA